MTHTAAVFSPSQTPFPWFQRSQIFPQSQFFHQDLLPYSLSSLPRRNIQRCLRIEARASPRRESAKIRNRRLQKKLNGTPAKPRLSVFCSSSQLYAALIDDQNKKTLFFASTLQKSIRGDTYINTMEAAQRVGEELVNACIKMKISEISSYDRNGFARGERIQAFEIAIAEHGFLPR